MSKAPARVSVLLGKGIVLGLRTGLWFRFGKGKGLGSGEG